MALVNVDLVRSELGTAYSNGRMLHRDTEVKFCKPGLKVPLASLPLGLEITEVHHQ